jgi:HSP20 family protein
MNNKVCTPRQHGVPMLFDRFFAELNNMEKTSRPAINIAETDSGFLLEMAIPGVPKEEVKIEMDGSQMLVSHEVAVRKEEEGLRFKRKEFVVRGFARKFELPEEVDRDQVTAQFEHGVLRINLPKKQKEAREKRQMIPIQ